jgi:hypothetical protein
MSNILYNANFYKWTQAQAAHLRAVEALETALRDRLTKMLPRD